MSKYEYDYLIVGSGLYGAVFSHLLSKNGRKCLVIDKRHHIGGNIYCENVEAISVHKYGPHIFHTDDNEIWKFVNSFVEFRYFTLSPLANYKGELYNLPFNMNTFYQLWKVKTPEEARKKIEEQRQQYPHEPGNLEEEALSLVGRDIYYKLVKGYSEKQWGRDAKDIPASIIKRIPLRFTFDNNYFDDQYQGIPVGGYNPLINGLLKNIEVRLNTDFFLNREYFERIARKILYTGCIDQFYSYEFGRLAYRSLLFASEILATRNYQGSPMINYTEKEMPYTRIIEHKHFEKGQQECTVITKEFPQNFNKFNEPYYPINDEANNKVYRQYREKADSQEKYLFGGRLADYKYYNMDKVIKVAMERAYQELQK